MKALFDFISKLLAALSRAAGDKAEEPDAPTPEKVSTVDTQSAAPHGWGGPLPYRYIDVSRYQGTIDWAQVAAAGYKGAMLKTVSTNRKLSKRSDGLYIDPTFERNYRGASNNWRTKCFVCQGGCCSVFGSIRCIIDVTKPDIGTR